MDNPSLPGDPRARTPSLGVPCVQCGYDLSGAPENANCPECGSPAATTLTVSLYRQPLDVIARARSSVYWIAAAIIAGVGGVIAGGVLEAGLGTPTFNSEDEVFLPLISGAVFLLVNLLALIGFWKFATPMSETSDRRFDRPLVRTLIRVSASIAFVMTVPSALAEFALYRGFAELSASETGDSTLYNVASSALVIIGIVSLINSAVLYLSTAAHAATLAARGARLKLERRAKLIYRLGIAAYAIVLVASFFTILGVQVPGDLPAVEVIYGGIAIVGALLFVVLGIAWLVMLSQTLSMLSKVRRRLLMIANR